MGDATVTTSDGEEHDLFACDVCGEAPVLRLLDEHPDHDTVDDIFRDDGLLKRDYLCPEKVYNPLSFEETGITSNDHEWVVCHVCREWVEYMLDGALTEMFAGGPPNGE